MKQMNKYSIVYSFQVFENKTTEFIQNWSDLTQFIYKTWGSLGSRLHQVDATTFFATAVWPNKEAFDKCKSDSTLYEEAESIRIKQSSCVKERNVVFQGNVITDLLK